MDRTYCVYILTNSHNTVLYTGVTNDLKRRVCEHKDGAVPGFTKRYQVNKLVYYDITSDVHEAIATEKRIKAGFRQDKINLVNAFNKVWKDLYDDL